MARRMLLSVESEAWRDVMLVGLSRMFFSKNNPKVHKSMQDCVTDLSLKGL